MPKITIIEPKISSIQSEGPNPSKLRVAAYARVSTEQEEQEGSLKSLWPQAVYVRLGDLKRQGVQGVVGVYVEHRAVELTGHLQRQGRLSARFTSVDLHDMPPRDTGPQDQIQFGDPRMGRSDQL